jgi:hypothetical protein
VVWEEDGERVLYVLIGKSFVLLRYLLRFRLGSRLGESSLESTAPKFMH